MNLLQRWADAPWWIDLLITAPTIGAICGISETFVRWGLGW
jgi:hypothetical protein